MTIISIHNTTIMLSIQIKFESSLTATQNNKLLYQLLHQFEV